MKTQKIRITGMHCESCEQLLKSRISKIQNVKNINLSYTKDMAEIDYENSLDLNEVKKIVEDAGYEASFSDSKQESITFNHYLTDLRKKENNIIKLSFLLLIILAFVEIISYYGFFKTTPNFFDRFGYYFIFLIISIVINTLAIWHVKNYGTQFSCMSGMMVGMTIGMSSGFLIGMLVSATSGMFVGSITGMLIGIMTGVWCGKCCGVMGIMEGMMAGFMGGLMGAMTTLMLINDHLKLIVPILVLIELVILGGLDYMIYKEMRKNSNPIKLNNWSAFVIVDTIVTIIISWLMVYGPKSILFQ